MFESVKHWFDSLKEESKLFDHRDDEILHSALASVLYHVISADQHVDARERHQFDRILKQEFDLNDEQVDHLISAADQVLRESREFKEFLERNNGSGDKKHKL